MLRTMPYSLRIYIYIAYAMHHTPRKCENSTHTNRRTTRRKAEEKKAVTLSGKHEHVYEPGLMMQAKHRRVEFEWLAQGIRKFGHEFIVLPFAA
jgi:hypothetical protein